MHAFLDWLVLQVVFFTKKWVCFFVKMAKGTGFSKVMIQDAVKLEDESPIDEIKRLWNLDIFLYEEMMWIRTENKSLLDKMDRIGSIVKNDKKAMQRVMRKTQGKSLWKCLNTPLAGRVRRSNKKWCYRWSSHWEGVHRLLYSTTDWGDYSRCSPHESGSDKRCPSFRGRWSRRMAPIWTSKFLNAKDCNRYAVIFVSVVWTIA